MKTRSEIDGAWLIPLIIIGGMLWALIVEIEPQDKPMRYQHSEHK